MTEPDGVQYCPICGRNLFACNKTEVEAGEHASFVFVHDDIVHSDEDLEALATGVQ